MCVTGLLVLLLITFYLFFIDVQGRVLVDFEVYLEAAKRYAAGHNIYQYTYLVPDRWGREIDSYYFYPPLLAQVLSLLTPFGDAAVKTFWIGLSFLCLPLTALVVSKLLSQSWWRRFSDTELFLLSYFFIACFEPVYWGISDGQVTSVILLCLALFVYLGTSGRQVAAGLVLGVAIAIKMSPAILLLPLIRFRRWRACFIGVLCALALVVLPPIIYGRAETLEHFWFSLTAVINDESRRGFVFNYVFDRAVLAIFSAENSSFARLFVRGGLFSAAVLYSMLWMRTDKLGEVQLHSAMIGFMVLCSPIIWFHHFAWVLLPIVALSLSAREGENRIKDLTFTLGTYFALSQSNLMHYWAVREAPALVLFSGIFPGLVVLLLTVLLFVKASMGSKERG